MQHTRWIVMPIHQIHAWGVHIKWPHCPHPYTGSRSMVSETFIRHNQTVLIPIFLTSFERSASMLKSNRGLTTASFIDITWIQRKEKGSIFKLPSGKDNTKKQIHNKERFKRQSFWQVFIYWLHIFKSQIKYTTSWKEKVNRKHWPKLRSYGTYLNLSLQRLNIVNDLIQHDCLACDL